MSLEGEPKGMPGIELLDEFEEFEPEPEGVPNPEDEDKDEDKDEDDELELEPDGIPSPEAAAAAKAELGNVNPPGTFIPAGGWPPAFAPKGVARRPPGLTDTCESPAAPACKPA